MPVADYLVLTPLNEEFRYLREAWPKPLHEERVGKIHYYQVLHAAGHREASVVFAAMADMGQAWSGVFASEALRLWRPTTVVQVGIAGSVDKDVSVGDVIIPQEVIGYEVGDAIDTPNGPDIRFRSTGTQTDLALLGSAHALQDNAEEYLAWQEDAYNISKEDLETNAAGRRPSAHIGAKQILASGNLVMKSKQFSEKLRATTNHKITAFEMEAKGLYNAIRLADDSPATLIIRGISDAANRNKAKLDDATKGAFRRSSVRSAARFLAALIERRLRLGHMDKATEPLKLLSTVRAAPRVARELGLESGGGNSLCVAYDPLIQRPRGAARLELSFALEGAFPPNGGAEFALRVMRNSWTRIFRSEICNDWRCIIERDPEPYALALVVVGNGPPKGNLRITVIDEFGRTEEKLEPLDSGRDQAKE